MVGTEVCTAGADFGRRPSALPLATVAAGLTAAALSPTAAVLTAAALESTVPTAVSEGATWAEDGAALAPPSHRRGWTG